MIAPYSVMYSPGVRRAIHIEKVPRLENTEIVYDFVSRFFSNSDYYSEVPNFLFFLRNVCPQIREQMSGPEIS